MGFARVGWAVVVLSDFDGGMLLTGLTGLLVPTSCLAQAINLVEAGELRFSDPHGKMWPFVFIRLKEAFGRIVPLCILEVARNTSHPE